MIGKKFPKPKSSNWNFTSGTPSGYIEIFYGDQIPHGWVICDGNNGTPNFGQPNVAGIYINGVYIMKL